MAITAYFGTTTKRVNSTARPSLPASFSITFKQPCSLERPALILAAGQEIIGYNYFSMLGRYYWVTDCVSVRAGLWEIHGEVDPLATLRSAILASAAYVDYAGTGYNLDLADTRHPVPAKPVTSSSVSSFFRDPDPYYILTAAGQNGSLQTYAMRQAQFDQLLTGIQQYQLTRMPDINAGQSVMDTLKDFGNQLAQAFRQLFSFGSCLDAIVSCYWEPWQPVLTDVTYPVYLGDYNTGVSASRVVMNRPLVTEYTATFTLAGDWRDYSPFTAFSLYIPFVGVVQLPNSSVIAAGGSVVVRASYTPESGEMAILLREPGTSGRVISSYSARICADIKIARNSANVLSIASSGVRVLTGDFTAIPALAESCLNHQLDSAGSLGTIAAIGMPLTCIAQTETHYPPGYSPLSISIQGHTVGASYLLSVFEGYYVQTRDMHINGSGEDRSITESAESMLNGGVYLE